MRVGKSKRICILLLLCSISILTSLYYAGFHGYGYFQTAAAAAAAAQTSPNAAPPTNGMLNNGDRQATPGSSYYDYQMSSNRSEREYGRSGEMVTQVMYSLN